MQPVSVSVNPVTIGGTEKTKKTNTCASQKTEKNKKEGADLMHHKQK